MNKRWIIFPFLFLCTIMFTSCAKEDPYEVWQKANENFAQMKAIEMQIDTSLTASVDPITIGPIDMLFEAKLDRDDDNEIEAAVLLTDSPLIPELETFSFYYKDQVFYINKFGEKMKIAVENDQEEEIGTESIYFFDFTKEDMQDLQMTEGENGDRILSFSIESEALPMQNELLEENLMEDTQFHSLPFTFTVDKDNQIKAFSVMLSFSGIEEDIKADFEIPISVSIINTGEDVKIEFPDFSDYQETSIDSFDDTFTL